MTDKILQDKITEPTDIEKRLEELESLTNKINDFQSNQMTDVYNDFTARKNQADQFKVIATPTAIYTGDVSTSWTDLDLSSVVGKRKKMVFMKVKSNEPSDPGVHFASFRQNGETDDFWVTDSTNGFAFGNNYITLKDEDAGYVTCLTDDNGIIEMRSSDADTSVIIYIIAYF